MPNRNILTVAACVLCTALILGVFLVFPIWAPEWMREFKMDRGQAMGIFGGSGILMSVTMPLVGKLLTRQPAWRVITVGALVLGGGMIAASTLKDGKAFALLYVAAMGVGVAMAGILPCQALSVKLFPSRVGAIGGMMMVALAVTGVVFPFMFTALKVAIGWRAALAAMGAGVLAVIPLLALGFMRGAGEGAFDAAGAHGTGGHAAGGHAAGGKAANGPILRTWTFWVIAAGTFPMLATPASIQANMLPIVADHGVTAAGASVVLSALAVGTAIGAALFGWLADRIDPRMAVVASALLMAGSLFLLVGARGVTFAGSGAFVLGLASGGVTPLMSTFALRIFGAGYAPAFGLLNFFMLPYMLGPPFIGHVRDQTGSYNAVLLAAAPVVVLGALGMWSLRSARAAPAKAAHASLH